MATTRPKAVRYENTRGTLEGVFVGLYFDHILLLSWSSNTDIMQFCAHVSMLDTPGSKVYKTDTILFQDQDK